MQCPTQLGASQKTVLDMPMKPPFLMMWEPIAPFGPLQTRPQVQICGRQNKGRGSEIWIHRIRTIYGVKLQFLHCQARGSEIRIHRIRTLYKVKRQFLHCKGRGSEIRIHRIRMFRTTVQQKQTLFGPTPCVFYNTK